MELQSSATSHRLHAQMDDLEFLEIRLPVLEGHPEFTVIVEGQADLLAFFLRDEVPFARTVEQIQITYILCNCFSCKELSRSELTCE